MKKLCLVTLLVPLILVSCANPPLNKGDFQQRLFVASDLHYLSDDLLSDTNTVYRKETLTNDGRIQEKDTELLSMLIEKVNQEKPSFLVLTGDLTFNGEKVSHQALANELHTINEDTQVLVIPGNHDTFQEEAATYVNDHVGWTASITDDEFSTLYADFGYSGALSRDVDTLSYVFPLEDHTWALMLDTTLNRFNEYYGETFIGGEVLESTMTWIEDMLVQAQSQGIDVISFTHHSLLQHNRLFTNLFTLYNAPDLISLLQSYGVTLNFSGHIHIQNIATQDGFTDIASASLLDYGNRIGQLDLYEKAYEYRALKLAKDETFDTYSFNTFYNKYYQKQITANQTRYPDHYLPITDLIAKVNCYYFDGNYEKIHELMDRNEPYLEEIKTQGSAYVQTLFEVEKTNQDFYLNAK